MRTATALLLLFAAPAALAQTKPLTRKTAAQTVAAKSGPSATITAKGNADVAGATFTLGEVAVVQSGDKLFAQQLARVEIGTSPMPGMARILTPGDITVHLRGSHLDIRRVSLVAPPSMRVARTSHDVGSGEIVQAAIAAAKPAIADLPNATLEPTQAPPRLAVTTGKTQLLAGALKGSVAQGTLVVPVSVLVDGRAVQTVEVALRVHQKMVVVVARRVLQPHEIVAEADVMLAALDLPPGFAQPLAELKEAVGKRTTRRLLVGAPIAAGALETPPDLIANDQVTIEYVYGPIRITAPGLARQAGVIGDVVRIYALDTRRELEAVIVDRHTVRLTMENADNAGSTDADTDESTN